MQASVPLVEAWRAGLPERFREHPLGSEDERTLELILEEGVRDLEGVKVPDDVLAQHLARFAHTPRPDLEAFRAMHLSDVCLACACVRGDGPALRRFESLFVPEMRRAVGHMRMSPAQVDELIQSLRERLLVSSPERRAQILDYSGRGELRAWLKVTTVRAALKVFRAEKSAALADEDEVLAARAGEDDPGLAFLKAKYREAFRRAFDGALSALSDKDRLLLRQSLLDGLSIDDLSRQRGIHRATAARWLQKAREDLLLNTKHRLRQEANLTPEECESVLRLVWSRLDVTFRGLAS